MSSFLCNVVSRALQMVSLKEQPKVTFYKPPDDLKSNELRLNAVIEKKYHVQLENYEALHRWSCDNYAQFWETLLDFSEIKLSKPYTEVIDTTKDIGDFPKWFSGAELNFTENILAKGRDEDPAFISVDAKLGDTSYFYARLKRDVMVVATSLRRIGVSKGDNVCGFLPNLYETSVAMFATAAIGAVWCSASVDFGPNGVLDRFKQVHPKVLFTVRETTYKRKRFDLREKVNTIVSGLPSLQKVIVIGNEKCDIKDFKDYESSEKFETWDMFSVLDPPQDFHYEQVPFDHPLFVMFSSGTTGIPKAIVHTVGGTLLKHAEEHIIQGDACADDVMFFYTTCGWMMWNWSMSFLMCGGCLVLYDESPLEPDRHVLPKIAGKLGVTIIGMGAKLYDEYTKMGTNLCEEYKLGSIRMILSTGSPLKAQSFDYLTTSFAPQAVIGSISGGTDIIGCFMGSTLSKPVFSGECQCLYLGMDIKAFDHNGKEVLNDQGELVCLKPFPSMPSHFLGDTDFAKYRKAYFERFPGVWAHGDFCLINEATRGVVMLGRSDATLNRGGVRIGTAEIYSVVDTFEEIADCIVAGRAVPAEQDEQILLFVKLAEGAELTDDLKGRIRASIRTLMSPRHMPDEIHAVSDIPYTNSGKKVEMAVKQIVNGYPVEKASSLRNPDSLDLFTVFRRAN